MDLIALLRSAADVGARGQLRRIVTSSALVFLVAGLLGAGAPQSPPRFSGALRWADGVKGVELGLLVLAAAAASVFLQPLISSLGGGLQGSRLFLPDRLSAVQVSRRAAQRDRDESRWRALAVFQDSLAPDELQKFRALDERLMKTPARRERQGPTRLSGILRAADERVSERYGLDNVLTAAARFSEAQLVLFDLHRFALYDALLVLRPAGFEERQTGLRLTSRLWRGTDTEEPYRPPT